MSRYNEIKCFLGGSIAWEESEIFMGERCSEHIKSNQKRTVNRLLFNTILIPQCCWPPRTTLRNEDESTQATWSCKMNQNVKLLIWTIGTSTEKKKESIHIRREIETEPKRELRATRNLYLPLPRSANNPSHHWRSCWPISWSTIRSLMASFLAYRLFLEEVRLFAIENSEVIFS